MASTTMVLKATLRRATGNFILDLIEASLNFAFVDACGLETNQTNPHLYKELHISQPFNTT